MKPLIFENFKYADIVRGSNEDFSFIMGSENADETYSEIGKHCKNLLYTANKKGVYVRTPGKSLVFPVKTLDPVSTIGAGDNFNAGIVYSLIKQQIMHKDLENLDDQTWESLVTTAVDFATYVCMSYDNYISKEFAEKYRIS
jgi:fructokinase